MLIRSLIPAIACLVDPVPAPALALTSTQRRRGRQRLLLADGQELAIALPPGSAMYPGDQLLADDGTRFLICAAPESVLRIACSDATTYEIPNDVTIVYFFNPFVGPPFMKVIDNIGESIRRHPRKVHIFYTNPVMHDDVIQRNWVRVSDYRKGSVAVYECQ